MTAVDPTTAFEQQYASWNLDERLNWLQFMADQSHTSVNPATVTAVTQQWITQNYGADAVYLNNAEVGPILMQAAQQGWTNDELQAAIENTNFWKTTSDAQRQWQLTQATDPGDAAAQTQQMQQQIQGIATDEGITLPAAQLASVANSILSSGTTDAAQIKAMVVAQAAYSPTHPVGELGSTMDAIQAQAGQQMVPLSDQAAFQWAQNIQMGTASQDGANDYIQQMALSAYPQFATAIQSGQTMKTILDPYVQQTAKLLDVAPDDIDLTSAKFQPIINSKDPTTGQPAPMSLAQAADFTRGLTDYQTTADARDQASQVGEQIGHLMGAGTTA